MLLFISTPEIFFIVVILVLLFGAKKIPEIARGFGKGIREFKNATSDIQEEIRKTSTEITDRANVNEKKATSSDSKPDSKTNSK